MRDAGARSAPILVYGFPAEICISVNDEIVHGIPSEERILADGDLLKLDVTVEKGGYIADAAVTLGLGAISAEKRALIDCAERAFRQAMNVARAGMWVNDIGRTIEGEVVRSGFSVVRELTGHGVGRTIHEAPAVPNYDEPRSRTKLHEGLVLAIEPIIAMGSGEARESADGWTVTTADGSLAAHYEQTIAITRGEPMLLTAAA
jgi:methionyl aminopeptidase